VEPFHSFKHAGSTIELHCDEEPSSPAEWDNLGTLVTSQALSRDWGPRGVETMEHAEEDAILRGGWSLLYRYLRLTSEVLAAVPFRFDDYGSNGSRLYAADADSDRVGGYIYTTAARIRELAGEGEPYETREWAENALRGELQTWSDYVEGKVAGYVVRCAGVVVDSCWSYYPDHEPTAPMLINDAATNSYQLAWEELPEYLRGYAELIADAIDAAEYEQAERARAANSDVETR
jgi:hypothetical protein